MVAESRVGVLGWWQRTNARHFNLGVQYKMWFTQQIDKHQ